MGMNAGAGGDDDMEPIMDINTTPLIDVMLVLLIMLIITIPVQKHATRLDLSVDQQAQPPAQTEPLKPITVEIDFDGTLYWNGVILKSQADLNDRLKALSRMADQAELHLQPNRLVAYKHVIAVMAAAQRQGITKMGVIGVN